MPITLSQADYWELFNQTEPSHPSSDPADITWHYPPQLGQGNYRTIQLREGLELAIGHYHLRDDVILQLPDRPHPLEYSLLLSGQCRNQHQSIGSGQYFLCSGGIAPHEQWQLLATQSTLEVIVHIEPELFDTFIGPRSNATSPTLQQLTGNLEQPYLNWCGSISLTMQMVAQQILHCPYQGLIQQLYLESKVWELMALLMEQIAEPQPATSCTYLLKADDVERIHQASNILLQQINHPPSLLELARQVGLNDCTLKRGFRQVFGTTAFGYLHRHRLEQARQLLETEELNIAEVAQRVGFADRSYFTTAFRKQFGCNPSVYRRAQRARSRTNIPLTPQKNSA